MTATIDIKTMQEAATAEALRAVQSAAARWWSLEDIALQMRLSKYLRACVMRFNAI